MTHERPPWIYGEEGVLLPFEPEEDDGFGLHEIDFDVLKRDKRLLWKIKLELLKTALVFFFTRW